MLEGKYVPNKLLIQMRSNYQIRSYSPNAIMTSTALVLPYNYYAITRSQVTPHNSSTTFTISNRQNNNSNRPSKPCYAP